MKHSFLIGISLLIIVLIIPISFASSQDISSQDNLSVYEDEVLVDDENNSNAEDISYNNENIDGPDLNEGFTNFKMKVSEKNTFYVNSSYDGNEETGTINQPFKTLKSTFSQLSLNRDVTNIFIANGIYTIHDSFSISKNLNIVGESSSNTIIQEISDSQVFYIKPNNIVLNIFNLTITGGNYHYGGAIYNNQSTLNLINTIFDNNQAQGLKSFAGNYSGAGGAIYNYAGICRCYNSTFSNNKVSSSLNTYGGAIYNELGTLIVLNSKFINNSILNTTYGSGGAINNFNGYLTIFNSSFINNTVKSNYSIGGAVYNYEAHNVFIINSTISGNSLYGNYTFGSAIANKGVLIEIINSTITNNLADGISVENSTIYVINGNYNIINSKLSGNSIRNPKKNLLMCLEDQIIISKAFDDDLIINLPSKYDLRNENLVTSVKSQGNSGACWAFTTLASLESFLLKYENISYDFSENNLKNLMNSYGVNGTDWSDGGNYQMGLAYLLRWDGPIDENDDAFSSYSVIPNYDLIPLKHVQGAIFLPLRMGFLDNDQIKYAIMKYGALYTSIYGTSMTKSIYNSIPMIPNHAVTIVGWDDNYPSSRFSGIKPPGNGAFIIKNSWGTNYGERGYGYVSYYDKTFAGFGLDSLSAMAFTDVDNVTNFNEIYQYDELGNTYESLGYNSNTAWLANQFIAKSTHPLSAIGFYTFGKSQYCVDIYVNEELMYSQDGNVDYAGYHTVNLLNLVNLTTGDVFRINLKLTTFDSLFPIAIETSRNGYSSKATADLNQSFVSPDGIIWYDIAQDTNLIKFSDCLYDKLLEKTNVCLKAYTSNIGNLVLSIDKNMSYFKKEDMINITFNLTNIGDYMENINVTVDLDNIFEIKEYNCLGGLYDEKSCNWIIPQLKNGGSVFLNMVLKAIANKDFSINNLLINSDDNYITKLNYTFNLTYSGFTQFIVNNITIYAKSNNETIIQLVDMLKNPISGVVVNINNENFITNENGEIKINMNLNKGSYSYYCLFNGDSNYYSTNITFNVNVIQKEVQIFANNLVTDVVVLKVDGKTGKYFKVILKDKSNNILADKKIIIVFINKSVKLTTNKYGEAKLQINVAKSGNYKITVNFLGDDEYKNSVKTSLIKINKKKPVLNVPKKIYKSTKKVKKLTAQLKINKKPLSGKKLIFKINGKKYSSKTNKNGLATVKIKSTKIKTGKFTVTFKGDSSYKKVIKKGKIRIK